MSRSPLLLAMTWLVTCLAVLTAGLTVRLAPVEKTVAWPSLTVWPTAESATAIIAMVLAVAAALMLILMSGSAREGSRARPFAEILVFFPVLLGFVWLVLPAGSPDLTALISAAVLAIAAGFLIRLSPGPVSSGTWKNKKSTIFLDLCLIIFPVLLSLALGHSPDLKAGTISLFLYPLYALVQLGVFLIIPVTRLRALGVSTENSTLFSALIFSLIHWPNPLVMLITLAGMLIWAHQYQKGRRLWQLALVMGLTATTISQFMPDDLTRHMRVGPGYVRSEAITVLVSETPSDVLPNYLEFIYPQILGRQPLNEEIQTWEKLVAEARPGTWAYMFLTSAESRRRLTKAGLEQPPADSLHWSAWPKHWQDRIADFDSPEYWEKSGADLDGYLKNLYRDILGRGASPQELNSWKTDLTPNQKARISEVLLDWQLKRGQDVFSGMTVKEFRFPN